MHKKSGFKSYKRSHSGDDSNEDPPVPIPNTEVKLVYARCTCLLRLGDKVVAGFQLKSARFHSENGLFHLLNYLRIYKILKVQQKAFFVCLIFKR